MSDFITSSISCVVGTTLCPLSRPDVLAATPSLLWGKFTMNIYARRLLNGKCLPVAVFLGMGRHWATGWLGGEGVNSCRQAHQLPEIASWVAVGAFGGVFGEWPKRFGSLILLTRSSFLAIRRHKWRLRTAISLGIPIFPHIHPPVAPLLLRQRLPPAVVAPNFVRRGHFHIGPGMHESELIKIIAYICNSGCLFNGWTEAVMTGGGMGRWDSVAGWLLYWRVLLPLLPLLPPLLRFIAPAPSSGHGPFQMPLHFIGSSIFLLLFEMKAF